jgi:hypothetical protein
MSMVVKRDGTVTWRGHRIGTMERLENGWVFTPDVNPAKRVQSLRRRDIVHRMTRDLVAAERNRIIDFARYDL